MDRLVKANDYL